MSVTLPLPNYIAAAIQRPIAEALGGSREVFYYLNNFPDNIYTKAPDTHLYALMRTILGENGVNFMSKSFYQGRAITEEMNLDVTDLDNFFGNPFGFTRSPTETYTPPTGPVLSQVEQQMRSSDSSYFARAVNYINGARAGNTPLGMQKVSEAGLGYGVEIIENYQYLYDQHSDLPLGLPYFGQTLSTNEFIVLPQAEVSQTEVLQITLQGTILGGYINFGFGRGNQPDVITNTGNWSTNSTTYPVPAQASRDQVRIAIENLIGAGNVNVSGDPGGPWFINFQGDVDIDSISMLNIYNNLTGPNVTIFIDTIYGTIEANEEFVNVDSADQYTLINALSNIQPVNSFATISPNSGIFNRVNWNAVTGSSEYSEVVRFVTGNPGITWPSTSLPPYWIVASEEEQAPRIFKDVYYNYQGWHNIAAIYASSEGTQAIQTTNAGPFPLAPFQTFTADQALANYAEPLFVTSSEENVDTGGIDSYINRIYPVAYENLPGAPPLNYTQQFWQSQPDTDIEWLIIDLGTPQGTNYITFDMLQVPVQIDIFYDTFDNVVDNTMNFVQATPITPWNNVVTSTLDQNQIASMAFTFSNRLQQLIFTRRVQILFTRLNGYSGAITVQNLRAGRNIAS